jgi:hypothetical protein
MPTVLRWNGYRFYFFSNEGSEPPHIHVDKGSATAKVWLDPIAMARNVGYSQRELNTLLRKIEEEQQRFQEAWRAYFGG